MKTVWCNCSGGQWNSGGQCHKETEPIFNETYLTNYPSKMRALEYVLKEMKTPVTYLNISRLTDYRKDGHPSIYRMKYKTKEEQITAEQSQDCSHWCLPGVPDTWNELLYASLLKAGWGSGQKWKGTFVLFKAAYMLIQMMYVGCSLCRVRVPMYVHFWFQRYQKYNVIHFYLQLWIHVIDWSMLGLQKQSLNLQLILF